MPRIFDNIDKSLLPALRETMAVSERADFCVGYFNLRGWKHIDEQVERWSGESGSCCRLLVGMQRLPQTQLRDALNILHDTTRIDQAEAIRIKKQLAREFREQLTVGVPNDQDEAGLRRLAEQLRSGKVVVKLFLKHPLHAKLYLLFRPDPTTPKVGYLGSSNLTFAGLSNQGELNIDVLDQDACDKLARWFENRWDDRFCVDISQELVEIIEESWAGTEPVLPYHIYLKMAWHLSRDARKGMNEFRLPKEFESKLFKFQKAAVQLAARHLSERGGVLIGDVVGLGKTLMATALARIFEDRPYNLETLIICPKNLVPMWEHYRAHYRLRGRVLSISKCRKELPEKITRYRVVLIDESHNLRNRDSKTYQVIHEYITRNESKVILLSATPYNKSYIDLSSQLRLFIPEDADVGVRPENLLRELQQISETEFSRRHQCSPRSLAAFEKSEHADDWRELMRLYLVRRDRTFIQENYAETDPSDGRKYLEMADGTRSYFPERVPKTVKFEIDDSNPADQYALLYSDAVVNAVDSLNLPRYGLGNYLAERPHDPPTTAEARVMGDLSRSGNRLRGFCRTNLFKRLESSGHAFVQSVERHILRNYVYLHALEHGEPLPIGTQNVAWLDTGFTDADNGLFTDEDGSDNGSTDANGLSPLATSEDYRHRAAQIYETFREARRGRFRWLDADHFVPQLAADLQSDSDTLREILVRCGPWDPERDTKLEELYRLAGELHSDQKLIVFSQFSDTVDYLTTQLQQRGIDRIAAVTGSTSDPTRVAWRFSPNSNGKRADISESDEYRILIATDVLSEGQNLQDAAIIVNFDLPWAIIRLFQRAGRVDRIGQQARDILCYTFLPAEGVERIIQLRSRVRQRLKQNLEVVGTDEAFFEDDGGDSVVRDLFTEKADALNGAPGKESDTDLASKAFQIWQSAIERDPRLAKIVPNLQPVLYSTKRYEPAIWKPEGVLAFVRTAEDHDALVWLDRDGNVITESQHTILEAAKCEPETPAVERLTNHHELVRAAVELVAKEEKSSGGQLGRPSSARFRTYERLKHYLNEIKGTLFDTPQLRHAFEDIWNYPLRTAAKDALNRLLRAGVDDDLLAERVVELRDQNKLSVIHDEDETHEPQIICSLGLADTDGTPQS